MLRQEHKLDPFASVTHTRHTGDKTRTDRTDRAQNITREKQQQTEEKNLRGENRAQITVHVYSTDVSTDSILNRGQVGVHEYGWRLLSVSM